MHSLYERLLLSLNYVVTLMFNFNELETGFEPAWAFNLWITKPTYSTALAL